jgi:hypothetical protein
MFRNKNAHVRGARHHADLPRGAMFRNQTPPLREHVAPALLARVERCFDT